MKIRFRLTLVVIAAVILLILPTETLAGSSKTTASEAELDPLKIISTVSALVTWLTIIFGTLISTFKSFRRWVVKRVRKALCILDTETLVEESTKKNQEELTALGLEIKTLIQKVDKLNDAMQQAQVSDKAILREGITRIYYKYHLRKRIPVNERENVSQLYTAYDAIKGNSYVHDLFEEIKTWQITYPEMSTGDGHGGQ